MAKTILATFKFINPLTPIDAFWRLFVRAVYIDL